MPTDIECACIVMYRYVFTGMLVHREVVPEALALMETTFILKCFYFNLI